jgi:hypothetical protein
LPSVELDFAWLGCRLMDGPAQSTYCTTHHVKQVIVPRTARRPHFSSVFIFITVQLLIRVRVSYTYVIEPKERCPELCQILRETPCILKNNLRRRGWGEDSVLLASVCYIYIGSGATFIKPCLFIYLINLILVSSVTNTFRKLLRQ